MVSGYTEEQEKVIWKMYINYLKAWIKDCKDYAFFGESPYDFERFMEDLEEYGSGSLADFIDKYFIKKS